MLAVCLAALLALKMGYTLNYRVGSDEPQHLHVAWGWTQGMLPYRDFFDNHTPLFHLLYSPLLKWLGERADILIPMRLAMLPLFFVSLGAVYRIGATLFSRRAGAWAVIFAGLWPNFLLITSEFRTDVLWTTLWLVAIAVLAGRPFTVRRALVLGAVLGAAFGVSLKTSLMVIALALALSTVLIIRLLAHAKVGWRNIALWIAAGLAGMAVIPAAIAIFFYEKGAWRPFYYCIITHNTLPALGHWSDKAFHVTWFPPSIPSPWWFPLALPAMFIAARSFAACHKDISLGLRRATVFLAAGFFYFPLRSYWPLITGQDFLPVEPLLCIGVAAAVVEFENRCAVRRWAQPAFCSALLAFIAVTEIGFAFLHQLPWRNKAVEFTQHLEATLRLTDPGDLVMDGKGETIFRNRPFYYALEDITRTRIMRGLIPDDIPECLVATRTCVASTSRLPPRAMKFVEANYVQLNKSVRVAGRYLGEGRPGKRMEFDLVIPARYAFDFNNKQIAGTLDGVPYTGSRFLEAGHHEFQIGSGRGIVYVVWAQALERGFSPEDLKPMAKKKHPAE